MLFFFFLVTIQRVMNDTFLNIWKVLDFTFTKENLKHTLKDYSIILSFTVGY